VIATAGHVDHGKSTLVRALTGMEPDRWAEERRRGMTIDLGYAWTTLPPAGAGGDGPRGAGPAGDALAGAGPARDRAGETVAFVDVPGHERFVPNMLAGLGPVPAVLFVVAADGGWMPQSAEHLAAVDALGVRHGLLAVTRADLADPEPATCEALEQIARTSLGQVEAVPVSPVTGAGLDDLRAALSRLVARLPDAVPDGPVRMWIDRSFTIKGSGTVVTGTLPAGTISVGDELLLTARRPGPGGQPGPTAGSAGPGDAASLPVRVRGIESLGESAEAVTGIARVALNLRGVSPDVPRRGMALITPGGWTLTSEIDVRVTSPSEARFRVTGSGEANFRVSGSGEAKSRVSGSREASHREAGSRVTGRAPDGLPALPPTVTVHIGSARVPAKVRVLGTAPAGPSHPAPANPAYPAPGKSRYSGSASADPDLASPPASALYVRLALREPVPLHAGDRVLLRDPGAAGLAIYGGCVLDPFPPRLRRRGAGAAAASELSAWPDPPRATDLLRRHALLRAPVLAAAGVTDRPAPVAGDWLADPDHWARLRAELPRLVAAHAGRDPMAQGLPADAARAALGLPDRELVTALVTDGIVVDGGYLRPKAAAPALPPGLAKAVAAVQADLAASPFTAPDANRLRELRLDKKSIAVAARAGALLRIAEGIILAPDAAEAAARILSTLPQPFTTSQARQALNTSRRVAIPLLEYLDRAKITERLPGDTRRLRPR
jgi:selenocysteine-specific elongation factor